MQRLSSGLRVNSAADDAAGLARADSLRVKSRMIQAAMRNINDGFNALEVADKAATLTLPSKQPGTQGTR